MAQADRAYTAPPTSLSKIDDDLRDLDAVISLKNLAFTVMVYAEADNRPAITTIGRLLRCEARNLKLTRGRLMIRLSVSS